MGEDQRLALAQQLRATIRALSSTRRRQEIDETGSSNLPEGGADTPLKEARRIIDRLKFSDSLRRIQG